MWLDAKKPASMKRAFRCFVGLGLPAADEDGHVACESG